MVVEHRSLQRQATGRGEPFLWQLFTLVRELTEASAQAPSPVRPPTSTRTRMTMPATAPLESPWCSMCTMEVMLAMGVASVMSSGADAL